MLTLPCTLEVTIPSPAQFVFSPDFSECVVVVNGQAIQLSVTPCAPHTLAELGGIAEGDLDVESGTLDGAKVFLVKHVDEALASMPDPR